MNRSKTQKDSLEIFSSAPVWQAVLKNALPAMAAMIMVLIYNLADTFFIAQTNDALMVAAVSLATPVFLIFMSLGSVFGIGGTSVISRALGQGRKEYAKKVCAFCMWGSVIVGVLMAALFLLFMNPLLSLIGASADTWDYAKNYLSIVSLCGPFVLISNCYANIIRTEGKAGIAMIGQFGGNLLNVILDPILILVLGWNVAGAAAATAISNIAAAVYYLSYFKWGHSILSIHPKDASMRDGILTGVLSIGVPAALGSFLMSISNILLNSQMAHYSDMAVAGIGVAMKVSMITSTLCIGFAQGTQALLGYCIGAKNRDRYQKCFRFSAISGLCLSTFTSMLCFLLTDAIISIFLSDPKAYEYAFSFVRILLTTNFLFGFYYEFANALQAMGAAVQSFIVNISRQGLIYIPALFILQSCMGVYGLVWAQPAADVLSLILAMILYRTAVNRLFKTDEESFKETRSTSI